MAEQLQELVQRWFTGPPVKAAGEGRLELTIDGGSVQVEARELAEGVAELAATWRAPDWLASRESEAMPRLDELAEAMAQQRSGLLRCQLAGAGAVDVRMTVYLEGISRQTLTEAVAEVGRTYMALERIARDIEGQRGAIAEAEQAMAEARAAADQAAQAAETARTAATAAPPPPPAAPPPPPPAAGTCPACGTVNPPEYKFCTKCGGALA